MSEKFKGFVAKIGQKTGQGRKGPWTLYSCKIEKEDGTEYPNWISLGFDAPKFKEGDYVAIYASENEKGYLNADEVKRLKNAPERKKKQAAGGGQGGGRKGGYGGGGGGDFNRQTNPEDAKRMSYANARTAAIELVNVLLTHGALPITAAKGKAAEAKREEEIAAFVDKYTVQYFQDGLSLRLLELVEDARGGDDKEESPLPGDNDDDSAEADEEEADEDDDEEEEEDVDD